MTARQAGLVGLMAAAALLFSSCAGRHKPPSSARMDAATKRLSTAIDKAQATEVRASGHVEAARKAADKEAVASASVLTHLNELLKVLPPELKARGDALKQAVDEDQAVIGEIVTHVDGAQREHGTLTKEIAEVKGAKVELETEQGKYKGEVAKVTDKLNAAEKQLVKEKVFRWLWRIGGGFVVLLILGGVVLFFTGKLGVVLAKIGIKAVV